MQSHPVPDNQITAAVPLVSIVVPTFNQVEFLPATIDNCLFQTYPNLELIVIDGGSTDGTKSYLRKLTRLIKTTHYCPVIGMSDSGEIVRQKLKVYPQNRIIRIITFDKDIGPTRTYNEGLGRVSGEYCTYIVGDDLPHPHMIEELVAAMERFGVDFVYSDMDVMNDNGRIVRRIELPDYDFQHCLADWFRLGVSKLYRAELHEEVGLMNEEYTAANDYDHYLRFAMAGARFYHLRRVLYSVRWHGPERRTGQHTAGRYKIMLNESKACAKRARDYVNDNKQIKIQ